LVDLALRQDDVEERELTHVAEERVGVVARTAQDQQLARREIGAGPCALRRAYEVAVYEELLDEGAEVQRVG